MSLHVSASQQLVTHFAQTQGCPWGHQQSGFYSLLTTLIWSVHFIKLVYCSLQRLSTVFTQNSNDLTKFWL